ncbi:MAG: acyltransferase [Eubacterium sp.]|nr:acyltransferase [Eubacterium sp.]
MSKARERLIWIDNVKVVACALVVLGHMFQGLIQAKILPEGNAFHFFIETVYFFHVRLFFICSGYLYQRYSKVQNFSEWKNNILKKLIDLGIPYFTFATATWVLKFAFSSFVNNEADGLFYSLFINPIAPYWYLFCLFFMLLFTPTFSKRTTKTVFLILALVFKAIIICLQTSIPYNINQLFTNYIWLILGMLISELDLNKVFRKQSTPFVCVAIFVVFILGSLLVFKTDMNNIVYNFAAFLLGIIACTAVIGFIGGIYSKKNQGKIFGFLTKYTLPIYLMHTIFAASLRALLLKLSVTNPAIHIISGLIISFAGPIIAALIMNKTKYLEFFIYPRKTIKRIKEGKTIYEKA